MKKTIINYTIAVILTAIGIGDIYAQPRIHYGTNNSYMYWPMPSYNSRFNNSGHRDRSTYIGENLVVNGFHLDRTGREETCTIYGVAAAVCIRTDENYSSHDPYTLPGCTWREDEACTINIYIYTATVGDSAVELVKHSAHYVHGRKVPDRVMILVDSVLEFRPQLEMYMHEFYFDEPVTVTGPFLVGMISDSILRFAEPVLDHAWFTWVYKGQVDIKESKIVEMWGVAADTLPDSNVLWGAPMFYPILVPEGSFIGVEQPQDAASVRLTPNPARTEVTVEAGCAVRSMEVVDIMGRTVIRKDNPSGAQRAALDVSRLPQGCYAVRLNTARGILTEKLVVK